MEIYFDEPFLTIHWEEDGGIVWTESKGPSPGGEPMRRGMEAGLRLIIEKKGHRWFGDARRLSSIDPADVKWINEDWVPRAVAAGLNRMAIVVPKRVVVTLAAKSFLARINGREMASEYFDDFEAARAWLRAG
jgi:hypothetical protein